MKYNLKKSDDYETEHKRKRQGDNKGGWLSDMPPACPRQRDWLPPPELPDQNLPLRPSWDVFLVFANITGL